MNKVMLVGRIVKDPNVFQTSLGVKYARFRIAVNRPVARNQADFVPIVVWRQQAEFVEKYLKKGALIAVEGWFTSSVYQNSNNQVVVRYEITGDHVSALETKSVAEARNQNQNISRTQELQINADEYEKPAIKENLAADQKKESLGENDVPWDLDL
ncbi:single-stranded DNA-binding protein [Mycoplasma sp. ATU-Cv-703]|uniref:single-stranded DNA-binding protein n=1 Tax=Mycoplasma sp. ATU-Cv-703 TaxID=2498595 RepID=UPI000FDE8ECC